MNSTSRIFESWETLFSECFAIGGRYSPHSQWSSPTRYIAYEPGSDAFLNSEGRQHGRFTFEASVLADLIEEEYGEYLPGCPENFSFHRWLKRADVLDERVTKLPYDIGIMAFWIERLLERSACTVFCRSCARTIKYKLIREVPTFRTRQTRILCPSIHLLITGEGRRHYSKSDQDLDGLDGALPDRLPVRAVLEPWDYLALLAKHFESDRRAEDRPRITGQLRNRYGPRLRVCYSPMRTERASRPIVKV